MPRVVHFEIHADDPERAIAFYSALFGWTFHKWEGPIDYWLIVTGEDSEPGINGGMIARQTPIDGEAVIAYVCTVDVDDVDEYTGQAEACGASIVVPKMPIPQVGWLTYAKDPEGNIFGIMQRDPDAG